MIGCSARRCHARRCGHAAPASTSYRIVAAEWDFENAGTFAETSLVGGGAKRITVTTTHRFDRPGAYFPALRGVSERQGSPHAPYADIRNLGRVRVLVK